MQQTEKSRIVNFAALAAAATSPEPPETFEVQTERVDDGESGTGPDVPPVGVSVIPLPDGSKVVAVRIPAGCVPTVETLTDDGGRPAGKIEHYSYTDGAGNAVKTDLPYNSGGGLNGVTSANVPAA